MTPCLPGAIAALFRLTMCCGVLGGCAMVGMPLNDPSPRDMRAESVTYRPGTPQSLPRLHIVVSTTRNLAMGPSEGWATVNGLISYCEGGTLQIARLIGVSSVATEDGTRPVYGFSRQEAERMSPSPSGRYRFSVSLAMRIHPGPNWLSDLEIQTIGGLREGRDICVAINHGTVLGHARSRSLVIPGAVVADALAGV